VDIGSILGSEFDCECGRRHALGIRDLVYADDAIERMPEAVYRATGGRDADVVLVADCRTHEAAGHAVEAALRADGRRVRVTILEDAPHGDPVCDDVTLNWLETRLTEPAGALVAVGSGVVNDLCKWVAARRGIPYIVFATAASMNGYSSANIAPAIRGVKKVIEGVVPEAILTTPDTIAGAPFALTAAGLGDVLAKPVSVTDWRINHLLFGEYYCPLCARLIRDLEPVYLNAPGAVARRDPETLRALFLALVYSGVSMTLAGTSFPASGGEHMVSHVLDMTAMRDGRAHDYHGRQVGLGTIFASALYEQLLALESPEFRCGLEPADEAYWGVLTPVVEEEHAGKRLRAVQAVERLREGGVWDEIRTLISAHAIPAARIKACLREAGAAHRVGDIDCTREQFSAAVLRSHQIRARYTVLDLARATGILPAAVDAILDDYLT
jgi:glycerol-1-phosphate dehydrogenase [NAD(P)+]